MSSSNDKIIYATEDIILDAIMERLRECDGDELAHISGAVLGGTCNAIDGQYEFTPTENYVGGLENNNE